MDEPSVLDYLKYKLAPWKYPPVEVFPDELAEFPAGSDASEETILALGGGHQGELSQGVQGADTGVSTQSVRTQEAHVQVRPYMALTAVLLGLAAQRTLEPSSGRGWNETSAFGVILFIIAAALAAWASWRDEWRIADPPAVQRVDDTLRVRSAALFIGVALALLALFTTTDNRFSVINFSLLALALIALVATFWRGNEGAYGVAQIGAPEYANGRKTMLASLKWALVIGIVLLVSAYFRFAQLNQIPGEMNSDHAEKILDIIRLLAGQTSIFFPNNGGREALQMYLAAGLVKFFGLNLDFLLLKIVSSGVGFLTLPFFYLIGKEIGNKRVGLLAMAFAGIAYWPNVVSRLGLRLPFYFLFTASALYFLIRGLRRGTRNDFILLGIVLGLSFYGYSADRILPFVILMGVALYLVHTHSSNEREQAFWLVLMALVIALVIFFPMLRYLLEQPGIFLYRTLTRVSGVEQPLPAPAVLIFFRNAGRALTMFSWSNGEIWTTSIPFRPALDVASGALFWMGAVITWIAYLRRRHWVHLFLLLSIPLLMLPSILALAFPSENPNLYRTAGAAIPVFLLIGLALDGLMTAVEKSSLGIGGKLQSRKILSWGLAGILIFISAYQSYHLVFDQYRQQYQLSAWNTTEMGDVVRGFAGTYGSVDNVWVMGYPYWVDTRLVGITAGYPLRDFAMFPEEIGQIPDSPEAKLFIINPQDEKAVSALQQRFTNGILTSQPAKIPGKEFLIFFVPPQMG